MTVITVCSVSSEFTIFGQNGKHKNCHFSGGNPRNLTTAVIGLSKLVNDSQYLLWIIGVLSVLDVKVIHVLVTSEKFAQIAV